jgi:hypothetical protein
LARAKRFIQKPLEERRKVKVTENVLTILQEIDYHGLMRTHHLFDSFPTRNRNNLYTTLRDLFDNEFVGSDSEFDYRKHHSRGSLPKFYWLRPKGKYVLSRADRPFTGSINYDPKPPKLQNLEHNLTTTDVMVKVKMYCLRHNVRFISHYEILEKAPPETQYKDNPFKFKVPARYIDQDTELWIEPDKVFGIERQDGKKAYFFLETDMGSEPLKRSTPFVSSVYKKVVGYRAVRDTLLHTTQLILKNFIVIFMCW